VSEARRTVGVEPVSNLDQGLPSADIVLFTIPLTSGTRHRFNAKRSARMNPGALLVNASRWLIVETEALVQALNEKRIRAALFVTAPEPLPEGHPLWQAPNLLITPHVAGDSDRSIPRAFKLIREQVERFVRGEALINIVMGGENIE
jgi:phosphoglycerate dehydrogenase-like enzyme